MYCENCGEKLQEDSKFCPNCGVNVDSNANSTPRKENRISNDFKKGASNLLENWKALSGKKKVLSLIACCCIGWIVVGAIMGTLTPDQNTSVDHVSSYSSNVSSDSLNDVKNISSESVNSSHGSSGSLSSTSHSNSRSSDSSSSFSSSSSSSSNYVGNANTKKFHSPSCSQGNRIKDSNKVYFSSRDEAISNGYVPCKICNP